MIRDWNDDTLIPHELATSLRVPLVPTPFPRWHYLAAIVVGGDGWSGYTLPTDDEVRAVASFVQEYRDRYYRESYIDLMARQAPYDIDGGYNGVTFAKRLDGGWGCKRRTWVSGAARWDGEPTSLVSVMDGLHDFGVSVRNHWAAWKHDHADIFDAAARIVPTPVRVIDESAITGAVHSSPLARTENR